MSDMELAGSGKGKYGKVESSTEVSGNVQNEVTEMLGRKNVKYSINDK